MSTKQNHEEDCDKAGAASKVRLRVLAVEDTAADAELCLRELKKAGYETSADRVEPREAFLERLHAEAYDVLLSDYGLPSWNGLDVLECLQGEGKDISLILVTGMVDDEKAVQCIQRGGADFVFKDRLARTPIHVPPPSYRSLEGEAVGSLCNSYPLLATTAR